MKVVILNDETIETYMGGAALVNDTIKLQLEKQGHEVVYDIFNATNRDYPRTDIQYDFYILANIGYVPEIYLKHIIDTKRYIVFRHDIPTVLYTQPPSVFHGNFWKLYQDMFTNAEMTYFISPMQRDVFKAHFKVKDSKVIVPPLNIESFKNEDKKDRKGCLYIGDISMARGCMKTLQIMKKQFPNDKYHFIGKILDENLVKELEAEGAIVDDAIAHEDMPAVMNEYKTLFYTPEIYDSFCLKILEASLCGMHIIADTMRIGIFSWNKTPEQLKEEMNNFHIAI